MMGNLAGHSSRDTVTEPSLSLPRLGTSWRDMDRSAAGERGDVVSSTNGLFETKIQDKVVPEEVMEILLSYVEIKDILSVAQVCRLWKDITTNLSFWKSVCNKHGVKWTDIPVHVKNKPNSWIALHSICQNKLLQKNFVLNHSGEPECPKPLIGWTVHQNGGDQIQVEANPRGINVLPPDSFFNDNNNCIVTSYGFGEISYGVQLRSLGLNPSVMKLLLPFKIEYSQMVGARFDCGGYGSAKISTLNSKGEKVFAHRNEFRIVEGSNWTQLKTTVLFSDQTEDSLLENTTTLRITLIGKDSKFWAGHYGPKFARSCVRVSLIHNPDQLAPGELPDTVIYASNSGSNGEHDTDYNYHDLNFDGLNDDEEEDDESIDSDME